MEGNFRRRGGASAAVTLLDHGVDGIFASNDETAVGAMWALARRGISVPGQVKVIGFDGTAVDEFHEPTLTSVTQPFAEIGRTAVDLLQALTRGEREVESVVLEPTLVVGGSSER